MVYWMDFIYWIKSCCTWENQMDNDIWVLEEIL